MQNPRVLIHFEKHIHRFERFLSTVSCFLIIAFGIRLSKSTKLWHAKQDGGAITFGPPHLMMIPQQVKFIDGVLQFHIAIKAKKGKLLCNSGFHFLVFLWNGNKTIVLNFGRNVKNCQRCTGQFIYDKGLRLGTNCEIYPTGKTHGLSLRGSVGTILVLWGFHSMMVHWYESDAFNLV